METPNSKKVMLAFPSTRHRVADVELPRISTDAIDRLASSILFFAAYNKALLAAQQRQIRKDEDEGADHKSLKAFPGTNTIRGALEDGQVMFPQRSRARSSKHQ